MKTSFIGLIIIIVATAVTARGETRAITLDETIALAREQSVDAAVAYNQMQTSYWQYRTYRADLLPEVNFTATLPSYRKNYTPYQLDDGSYTFVRNNYLEANGQLSLSQSIWPTGGTISLNTSLDYLHQFGANGGGRWMSVPVALTLSQPVFGTNHTKWNRRIEPVRYEEAKAEYIKDTEEIAMKGVNYFFNLLMARENLEIAKQNYANSRKLHEVAKAKREMGQISQNDLLQMELNALTDSATLTNTRSNYKASMFQLRSFLGIEEEINLVPVIPEEVKAPQLEYSEVLETALEKNPFALNIRRRQLEADYQVAIAKGNLREVTLFAQFGYTGTQDNLKGAYSGLKDNQVVEVGVSIPLIDWGKRRGKVKVAESNREVVKSQLRQETMDFSQDIFMLVERFNNQRQQLDIATRADEIAMRRYDTNVETFLIGKISTLDLNDSQTSKDEARRDYINQLYLYWYYWYQIRAVTLSEVGTPTAH